MVLQLRQPAFLPDAIWRHVPRLRLDQQRLGELMTLLPFQTGDVVAWRGASAFVRETRGDRLVLELVDGMLEITTQDQVRERQPVRKGAA